MGSTQYGVGEYRAGEAAVFGTSRALVTASRRPVVIVGGAQRSAVVDTTGTTNPIIVESLIDSAYPIHAGDYCGHASGYWLNGAWTWGNSESANAISAALTWVGTYTASGKMMLFAASMGAADALNYYKANPTKVSAIALAVPLLSLGDLSSNDKGFVGAANGTGLDASMNGLTLPQGTINVNQTIATSGLSTAGLGGTGGAANKVNVTTSNGWQVVTFTGLANTGPGGNAQFTGCTGGTGTMTTGGTVSQGFGATLTFAYGVTWPTLLSGAQLSASSPTVWTQQAGGLTVPVKVWSSDNDPIASSTAACQTWAAAVSAAGGGNVTPTVMSMGAIGHNSLSLDARQVGAWFDSVGGRS